MPIIKVETIQDYKEKLNLTGRVYFLFFASYVDGVSWCPDCVKIEPFLQVFESSSVTLVQVLVGIRSEFKKLDNFYRNINITRVPTLMDFSTNQRWVEEQITKTLLNSLATQK